MTSCLLQLPTDPSVRSRIPRITDRDTIGRIVWDHIIIVKWRQLEGLRDDTGPRGSAYVDLSFDNVHFGGGSAFGNVRSGMVFTWACTCGYALAG